MKIAIATDHNGVNEKKEIINKLVGYEVIDMSTNNNPTDDYPDFAFKVGEAVRDHLVDYGVLLCGTGIGMSMAANKEPGIRAALCHDTFSAKATREHNDANILCMGARVVGPGLALMIIDTFLDTPFSNDERHIRRISMYS